MIDSYENRFRRTAMAALVVAMFVAGVSADDWPEWRGADRTDISRETNLLKQWPADGPERVWLFENGGIGYSGFAIVDNRLVTMGTRDGQTIVLALNASNGDELWHYAIGETLQNDWGNGPRSTPTIRDELVYAMSGEGALACIRLENGEVVWQRTMDEFGGMTPKWGYSESVLVDDGKVICTPGGDIGMAIALDANTGELIWQTESLSGRPHYSSFIKANHHGNVQYIQLAKEFVFGVDSETGEMLWQSDWDGQVAVVPTPIYHDELVYITSGYGVGCKLISLKTDQPEEVYKNKVMKNHHGGVILVDGYLYGHSDDTGWVCQSFADGKMVWREKDKLGKGAVASADGMLYCVEESSGIVALVEASPKSWQERGRFKLAPQTSRRKPRGRIWTHPVIANGKLYLRDQDLIYCFNISAS